MSECKKCDRCGEYYAKDIDNRKLGKLYDNGGTTKNEWDLCPDCWESFDSWIANDANAASVSVSRFIETGDGDNGAACKANSETCLTGQAVDKQADSRDAANRPIGTSAAARTGETAEIGASKYGIRDFDDSREKLEEDVHALCVELQDHHGVDAVDVWCGSDEQNIFERILLMLDRQEEITKREILGAHELSVGCDSCLHKKQADDLRGEWHRACAERANLARDLGECMADRDRYRALCGQMLDAAHEIRRIADANMPEGAVV